MAYNFEDVVVPHGSFIGWGNFPGQFVTGKVLDYDATGGTDFNGETCPQVSLELVEAAASFDKQGVRTDYQAGELVIITCGLVSLKRAIKAADPSPGDVIKATLESMEKTANGTVKVFKLQIARGAAPDVRRQSQQQFAQAPAQQFGQPAQPEGNPFGQAPVQPAQPEANPFGGQPAAAAPAQQANPFAATQPQANPFA